MADPRMEERKRGTKESGHDQSFMGRFRNLMTGGAQDTMTHATGEVGEKVKKSDAPGQMKHADMNYYHEDDGK